MNIDRQIVRALVVCVGTLVTHVALAQDVVAGKGLRAMRGLPFRSTGSLAGFRFSRAMKSAGYAWDAKSLDAYTADPQKAIPGNVMPFSGVPDAKQRADLIAYLKTLK